MKKIILSAAFLAIGTFAIAQQTTAQIQKKDPAQMQQMKADHIKKMQTELGLSNAQVSQITALQDKKMAERKANAPQMQAERKAKMDQMKSKKEQWNSEMKQILTPEQYQKWEANKKEKMHEKKGKMAGKKMKMMPAKN